MATNEPIYEPSPHKAEDEELEEGELKDDDDDDDDYGENEISDTKRSVNKNYNRAVENNYHGIKVNCFKIS